MKIMARKNKANKKTSRIRGKGDYTIENSIPEPLKRIEAKVDHLERSINKKASVKSAASTVGRTLGNFVNQGDMGALAGETLAKLFGHGDYTVKSNSLIPHPGQTLPKFSSANRGTRIVEREYIGDIFSGTLSSGSTVFSNSSYSISPTNAGTFPWFSTVAALYDQWEPHGIVFEFVSTSSEYNGTNQALGTVILATDYDPTDPMFATKQQAENADYSCSTKPSISLMHGIECDPKERPLPVLYTNASGASDLKFSSLGNFQICTQGMSAANVNLGELWVSYDITLYKKQQMPLVEIIPHLNAYGNNLLGQGTWSGLISTYSTVGITLTQSSATTSRITFPPDLRSGRFWIYNNIDFNGGGAVTYNNCSLVLAQNTLPSYHLIVDITGPNAYVQIGAATTATTWTLDVMQVVSNFVLHGP